ncbi:hypothetical protein [Rhodopila sp.]|uniref:hypothetical protein n=1 Tax=Rhodopila sp. TaxID=2480087 RepID=UPI003D0B8682
MPTFAGSILLTPASAGHGRPAELLTGVHALPDGQPKVGANLAMSPASIKSARFS